MIPKSTILGLSMLAPVTPVYDNTPSSKTIELIESHFSDRVEQIIEQDFEYIQKNLDSLEGFVWYWCEVEKVLETRYDDSLLKTTKYSCIDNDWNDIEFMSWYNISWVTPLLNDDYCSDITMFFSMWDWKYEYWNAAWVNKKDLFWNYNMEYYYTNMWCEELRDREVPFEIND